MAPGRGGTDGGGMRGFIINYAFYFSEIYRGGIQGVPAGQNEPAWCWA